jgi:hypothetical protein
VEIEEEQKRKENEGMETRGCEKETEKEDVEMRRWRHMMKPRRK